MHLVPDPLPFGDLPPPDFSVVPADDAPVEAWVLPPPNYPLPVTVLRRAGRTGDAEANDAVVEVQAHVGGGGKEGSVKRVTPVG
jgi:hypothetical protein